MTELVTYYQGTLFDRDDFSKPGIPELLGTEEVADAR